MLQRIRKQNSSHALRSIEERIVGNVANVCRSVVGNSPACIDYGLISTSDLTAHRFPQAELAKSIKAAIDRYEPRLSEVTVESVTLDRTEFFLNFEVTARLVDAVDDSRVRFKASMALSRKVVVTR